MAYEAVKKKGTYPSNSSPNCTQKHQAVEKGKMESTRSVDKQRCIIPVELPSRFKNRPFCFKGSKYELSDLRCSCTPRQIPVTRTNSISSRCLFSLSFLFLSRIFKLIDIQQLGFNHAFSISGEQVFKMLKGIRLAKFQSCYASQFSCLGSIVRRQRKGPELDKTAFLRVTLFYPSLQKWLIC